MFRFRRKKPPSMLGIDIRSSSIHVLELSGIPEQFCIEQYAQVALPQDPHTITTALKSLFSDVHFSSKHAMIAVPNSAAMSNVIQIDANVDAKKLDACVLHEIERVIPYPLDEIYFDYNVLGISSVQVDLLDVLIVASHADVVSQLVNAVEGANLHVGLVDVELHALERAACLLGYDHHIMLFEMEKMQTRADIFNGKHIVYSREDVLEAEISPEILVYQIKRALQVFSSTNQQAYIHQIVLTGDMTCAQDLSLMIHQHLGLPVHLANPFWAMRFSSPEIQQRVEHYAPKLMVACGLALHGLHLSHD